LINYTDNYFDLDLLRLSDIRLHEATENNRLRNIYNRISKSKYLMNPVIVGRHGHGIILLDGANRYGSLKEIGCKLILAQVFDYKSNDLILDTWNHLVYDFELEKLEEYCIANGLEARSVSYSNGINILKEKFNFLLAVQINGNRNLLVRLSPELNRILKQLEGITKLYFKKHSFDRSESDIKISDLKQYTRKEGSLIVFPQFTKQHIINIADKNMRLPAGISRHRIKNRVLHVKYEIKKLMNAGDINRKKDDLKKMLEDRIDKNKVRQYQDSVIVFDE